MATPKEFKAAVFICNNPEFYTRDMINRAFKILKEDGYKGITQRQFARVQKILAGSSIENPHHAIVPGGNVSDSKVEKIGAAERDIAR